MAEYTILEEYFIRKGIEKAIKIETFEKGNLTSSCVDDIFFILKKCVLRCISSCNTKSASMILSGIGKMLEDEYIHLLQKKISVAFSSAEAKDGKMGFNVLFSFDP